MMKKLFFYFGLIFACTTQAANEGPIDFVKEGSKQILDILKQDNGKNTKQVRQQAEAAAVPMFDFPRMTVLAMGVSWRQASPEQRIQLTQQFQTLLVRTYSTTMLRFKAAKMEVNSNTVAVNRDQIVKTVVTLPGNTNPVLVDYTLNKNAQGWRIYNVSVEGASLVTVYRNTFTEEVRKNGIDGLIKMLQDKNNRPAPVEAPLHQEKETA